MLSKISSYSSHLIYLAALLGLFLPGLAVKTQFLLSPLLIIIMTLSITDFKINQLDKKSYFSAIKLVLIHYLILSPLLILFSYFVIGSGIKEGFILLAMVPPAIGIVAVAKITHRKINNSFIALVISHVFSFFFVPLILILFTETSIKLFIILKTLIIFIFLPYILSIFIKKIKISEKQNKFAINIFYSWLFYIVIGIKSHVFFDNFKEILPIFLIMVFLTFGVGTIVFFIFKKSSLTKAIDYMLFTTYKNTALAAVISVMYFSPDSLIPISIRSFISPLLTLYIIFLNYYFRKKSE